MPFWREVMIGVAALFLVFLVVKMRPRLGGRSKLGEAIKTARRRAHEAKTPREKAMALLDAAELSSGQARWTAAEGFFLRAMLADPAWVDAVDRAIASLSGRRPEVLEKILWRRLSSVPWDDAHRAVLASASAGLALIYHRSIRDPARAEVMSR